MPAQALAADDVVRSWSGVKAGSRQPIVVLEPLERFFDELGLGSGPLRIEPLGDGHSNVTLLVAREGMEAVLRRSPRPPVPPAGHDMLREARILGALAGTSVPVPQVLAVCEDASLIGAPFCLTARVAGEVVTTELPAALADPQERHALALSLVDALVEIHAVDLKATGLDRLAKPNGYLERQLGRFAGSWEQSRTREIPAMTKLASWLNHQLPASSQTTLVHGDFRLGNVIAAGPPARIAAVLDWEMATLGDPLADLGYLLASWTEAGTPKSKFDLSPVTAEPGFPGREELRRRYEERSGRPAEDLRFYVVLALWKLAVIMEGNYRRTLEGASDDPFSGGFADGVVELAERAYAIGPGAAEEGR